MEPLVQLTQGTGLDCQLSSDNARGERKRDNHGTHRTQRPWPDPLWPEQQSILYDFMTVHPSFDALRARVLRNFTGMGVPKGERVEGLNVEILLSPDEARRGGVLRLGVPVFAPCTTCAGTGHTWGVSCLACMGQGLSEQEKVVAVRIPPQVRHGTILDMPLRGLGLHNFYLHLHIAVTAWG